MIVLILPDLYWDNYELVFCEAYGGKFAFYNTFVERRIRCRVLCEGIECGGGREKD